MGSILQPTVQTEDAAVGQKKSRPFIRLARFGDYDQIAALEARHGLTVKSQVQWLDLWLSNPAYLQLNEWPIGWVVENEEGRIVGSLGNVPTLSYLAGRKYVCAAGRGWAVDVKYRAFSVQLLVRQLNQRGADMNVITTPSPTTAALCEQLGWSRVPVGEWNRSQFWVTNYRKALQAYLGTKTSKLISGVVGNVVAAPLVLKDAISRRLTRSTNKCSLDWCSDFDERFDGLWEDLKEQSPGLMLGMRNAESLRWHFKHALQQNRIWILTVSLGSRLIGYAILERRNIQTLDLARVLFLDFQTLSKDADLCLAMIHRVLERCRCEDIQVLENMGCWMEKLQPIPHPPHSRNLETWCYLYRAANPNLRHALGKAQSWYPTQFDGDASL